MIIQNEQLTVEIAEPDVYTGTRFDHTLAVRQIHSRRPAPHSFLGYERTSKGRGTGGFGLQFGFLWIEAPPVQPSRTCEGSVEYPVLGAGLLSIPDTDRYSIFGSYDSIPPEVSLQRVGDDCVTAHCIQAGLVSISRTLSLCGRTLILQTECTNLSTLTFSAEEYCHNFFRFDAAPVSTAYEIAFDSCISASAVKGRFDIQGNSLRIGTFDPETETISAHINETRPRHPHRLVVTNSTTGSSLILADEFIPRRVYCWASRWAICPEVFFALKLSPGESEKWTRRIEIPG